MASTEKRQIEIQNKSLWKDPIFWFVIALGIGYGAVYNFLPSSFPIFDREFHASLRQMGHVQFLFFVSCLAFSVIGGPVIAKIGLKRSAIGGLGLAGAMLVLVGEARHFGVILVAAGLFGFSIIGLVVVGSSIVSRHFAERRQSVFLITGLSDSSGTMIGPAALGWWFVRAEQWHMSWRLGYFAAAMVMGALLIWASLIRPDSMREDSPETSVPGAGIPLIRSILASPAFYLASLLALCHGVAQGGMISFIGQLYVVKLHVDPAHAAYLLSLDAAGMLGGRLIFSWITSRWSIPELVVIGFCAMAESVLFLSAIMCPGYLSGAVSFTCAGIFTSVIGPSLNSYLGSKFSHCTATAFSLFVGLGGIGAAIGPLLIGTIGDQFGVARGILSSPLFSALLGIAALSSFSKEHRRTAEQRSVACGSVASSGPTT